MFTYVNTVNIVNILKLGNSEIKKISILQKKIEYVIIFKKQRNDIYEKKEIS